MRAQAIEKMLRLVLDEVDKGNTPRMQQLKAKACILLDREDDRDASVIRELMNHERLE